jgi:serine/threonine protein kinase
VTQDPAGAVVGSRYRILHTLGQGAFGRTLLAEDLMLHRKVAVKVLDAGRGLDLKAYELFEREADVLAGLRHQGIPAVHGTLREDWNGSPATFLIMEYIEGTSLAHIIESRQTLESTDVLHVFLELLSVLDYLHGRVPPILHRDIKPANIILRPNGLPALVDFGSVRRVVLGPDESGSTVAGTYGYMPYEQYMGQASPASDLYALGATFLHLLTGRPPREFMNEEGRIQVPSALPGDGRLGPVIERLLRPSPAERFARAFDVRQALFASTAVQPTAMVLAGERKSVPAARLVAQPVTLPPAPRAVEGTTEELLDRVSPSMWELLDASNKRESVSVVDVVIFGFFCVITAGVLPMVFLSIARDRRRRLRRFFKDGTPTTARVLNVFLEPIAFGEKLSRVSYEYEADGRLFRDSDQVLPVIANRWQPGDVIQILYIAVPDHDSVIISTS